MKSLSHLPYPPTRGGYGELPLAWYHSLETACTVCFGKGAALIGLPPAAELLSKLIFTGTIGIG